MRVLLAILILAPSSLAALAMTVDEAREVCKPGLGPEAAATPTEAYSIGQCIGTARGVIQVMVWNCLLAPQSVVPKSNNPPSTEAALRTFIEWAEANPDLGGNYFEDGVVAATIEAYPCVGG